MPSKVKETAKKKIAPKKKTVIKKKVVKKKPTGRPLFGGRSEKEVIAKLEEAFLWGCSDIEACLYADISDDALYRYCRKHEDFRKRKEGLKEMPAVNARKTVALVLKGGEDVKTAMEYLTKKKSDEFAVKEKKEHSGKLDVEQITGTEVK